MTVNWSSRSWRILFVDDEDQFRKQASELFDAYKDEFITTDGGDLQLIPYERPSQAFEELEKQLFDLIILDVKQNQTDDDEENEQAGRQAFEAIRNSRFIPVIFYTGLPDLVRDLESPTVRIVEKTEGLIKVIEEAKNIFQSGIPAINRGMIRLLEEVQKNYLWTFCEDYSELHGGELPDVSTLSYLLARRLSAFVSGVEGITRLVENVKELGFDVEVDGIERRVNPLRCYIMPSLAQTPRTGDVYTNITNEKPQYWIVLSPTCDLVNRKINQVLLAHCQLLENQREYIDWRDAHLSSKKTDKKLKTLQALLYNNRDKQHGLRDASFFLPAALNLPNLVVDFRNLTTLSIENLDPFKQDKYKRIASLDSPFAESLLSRFIQFSGRIGTPDLHLDGILQKLRQDFSASTENAANTDNATLDNQASANVILVPPSEKELVSQDAYMVTDDEVNSQEKAAQNSKNSLSQNEALCDQPSKALEVSQPDLADDVMSDMTQSSDTQ